MPVSEELAAVTQPEPARVRAAGERSARRRASELATVAGPAVLAGALCCYQLTGRSLGFDEAASVTIAAQHGGALGAALAHDGGNMSGYYLLLHVVVSLFGNSVFVVRFPSVVATVATVAVVGQLANRLFDRRVALASGLLTAVSLPLVFWGQAARGYAPMVTCVAASFLSFVVLVDRHADGRPIRGVWIAYVVSTVLAVFASFVAMLIVPAQLASLAIRRRAWRPVAAALIVCAACWVPLAVLALRRGSGQLFWVPRPRATDALQVTESLTSSGLQPSFHLTPTGVALLVVTVAAILGTAVAFVRAVRAPGDRRTAWSRTLVLAWLLVPLVLALLESELGQSIFLPRNLLMTLPAAAMMIAAGIFARRIPSALSWSALAVLLALRALQLAPSYGVSPENWRGATTYVLARTEPRDCIAFYPSDGRMAFSYYLGDKPAAVARAPRAVLPAAPWAEVKPYVEDYATLSPVALSRLPSACPRLWLISSHEGQANGPAGSRANRARYLALRAALASEFAAGGRESFGYASPVRVELFARDGV